MSKQTKVFHAELRGTRTQKSAELVEADVSTAGWIDLPPQSPFYFFVPCEDRE